MKNVNVRFGDSIHQAIKDAAHRNRRSLNSEILVALDYYLKNAPGAHYDPDAGKERDTEKQ